MLEKHDIQNRGKSTRHPILAEKQLGMGKCETKPIFRGRN